MTTNRLEAFSDGVLAVIITIMVLELKAPHSDQFHALHTIASTFGCYVISFIYIGIYWNNHHHMLHATEHVDGLSLWTNLHLLFWLSLVPFASSWMSENLNSPAPAAAYGVVLLGAGIAYSLLVRALTRTGAGNTKLMAALGSDFKAKLSCALYALAITLAYVNVLISQIIYVAVACMWLIPDRRIEKTLRAKDQM